MNRTFGARVGTAFVIGVAVLGLGACSTKSTVDAESAQQAVTNAVAENTKVTAEDVKCPADVEAKVDVVFDCTYKATDGEDYVAHLKITDVKNDSVHFDITSDPA